MQSSATTAHPATVHYSPPTRELTGVNMIHTQNDRWDYPDLGITELQEQLSNGGTTTRRSRRLRGFRSRQRLENDFLRSLLIDLIRANNAQENVDVLDWLGDHVGSDDDDDDDDDDEGEEEFTSEADDNDRDDRDADEHLTPPQGEIDDEYPARVTSGDDADRFRAFLVEMLLAGMSVPATRPLDEESIARLPRVTIHAAHLATGDKRSCVVCLEDFSVGSEVVQLPCGHVFCEGCIEQWLRQKRQCPMCRAELEQIRPSTTRYDVCALHQASSLSISSCPLHDVWFPSEMAPLPNCSHVYHPRCLSVAIAEQQCAAGDDGLVTVQCVLCSVKSRVRPPSADVVQRVFHSSRSGRVGPVFARSGVISRKSSGCGCCGY
eukprot:PhM_4_TR16122/c6_g1_i1/m.101372/K11982/RNF115_126; E3 ubiquitin-protein ligase RNF115/126